MIENETRSSERHQPFSNDLVSDTCGFPINDIQYRIEAYKSGAIKVMDEETGLYVPAKPVLRRVIDVYKMPITIENNNGRPRNTRQLGKMIIKHTDKVFRNAMENDPNSVMLR